MLGIHSQLLDLDKRPTFIDSYGDDKRYLNVEGVYNQTFSYGKHAFYISYDDYADSPYQLKEFTQVLFEIKDTYGTVIYSGNTDHVHINGSSISYFYIKQDPLRTEYDIANGPAQITLMAELEGVPTEWQNTYNFKLTIPFNIKKQYTNNSDIVFVDTPELHVGQHSQSLNLGINSSFGGSSYNWRKQDTLYFTNLETFGGEVKYLDVHYRHSSSLEAQQEWTPVGVFDVDYDSELLTRYQQTTANTYPAKHKNPVRAGFFGDYGNQSEADILRNWNNGVTGSSMYAGTAHRLFVTSNIEPTIRSTTLVHGKALYNVFHKTKNTEKFKMKMNVSGNICVGIWTVPAGGLMHLTYNETARNNPRITNNQNYWSSSVSQSLYVNFARDITPDFGEWATKNPTSNFHAVSASHPGISKYHIYESGSIGPYADNRWDEFTFEIPDNHYVMVGVHALGKGSGAMVSGSIGDLSIQHLPISGVNPPTFLLKTSVPRSNFKHTPYEIFEYKVNFLNHEKIPALDVTSATYPIPVYTAKGYSEVSASTKTILVRGETPSLNVENYGILSKSDGYWDNNMAIRAFAGPSASWHNKVGVLGTYGIHTQLNLQQEDPGTIDPDMQTTRVMTALGAGVYNYQNAIGKPRYGGGYSGSAWAAVLSPGDTMIGGTTGGNLAVGNFSYTQHPSESLHVKGSSLVEGDITASGDLKSDNLHIGQWIYHDGETVGHTGIRMTDKRVRIRVGDINYIDMDDSTSAPHNLTINDGANNVDFKIKGVNGVGHGNPLLCTDASTMRVGMHGVGSDNVQAGLHIADNLWVSGSNGHITASGDIIATNITATGDITANRYITSATLVDYSSGSTAFGNTITDIHTFTGSLRINGTDDAWKAGIKIDDGYIQFRNAGKGFIIFNQLSQPTYAKTWIGDGYSNNQTSSLQINAEHALFLNVDDDSMGYGGRIWLQSPTTIGNPYSDPKMINEKVRLHIHDLENATTSISASNDIETLGAVSASKGYVGQPYIFIKSPSDTITGAGTNKLYEFLSGSSPGAGSVSHSMIWNSTNQNVTCSYPGVYQIEARGNIKPEDIASNAYWILNKNGTRLTRSSRNYVHIINAQGLDSTFQYVFNADAGDAIQLQFEASGSKLAISSSYIIKKIS